MSKYKNKDGIELNYSGNDIQSELTREVIKRAIRIFNSHNISDKHSMGWAIDRGIHFLETNFDIGDDE